MQSKNKGYVVPVAIGVLVVASLGLLVFSWWGNSKNEVSTTMTQPKESKNISTSTTYIDTSASDDTTLEKNSVEIDSQIKALDDDNSGVDISAKDESTI